MQRLDDIKLSPKKIKSILQNPEKCAQAIALEYVNDQSPGIMRVKNGDTFDYFLGKKKICNKIELERIRKLVIPPAWRNVWICCSENGHLQATGLDAKNRKQYKYHPLWSSLRNQTKFYRLYEFGLSLPAIRQQLQKDLARRGLPVEKVLATVVWLMAHTSIRIGNSVYEKLYDSFGLTTLKDNHVKINGTQLRFIFKGKKGVPHNISINNKRLARIVKQCRDIPGKELFQYYDEEGNHRRIESGMVNEYLKSITGSDFTAKDFRTWAGTVRALSILEKMKAAETKSAVKHNVIRAIEQVAEHLGNTPSVCKKYYIHPVVIDLYENNALQKYLDQPGHQKDGLVNEHLTDEENLLMAILHNEGLGNSLHKKAKVTR